MLPDSLKALFWDTNSAGFDPTAYPDYTIFRVLEYGDMEAFKWIRTTFEDSEIRRIIRTERRLSPKSATFWALVFGIPEPEVAALCQQHLPDLTPHE
jgi:hypothetical protein